MKCKNDNAIDSLYLMYPRSWYEFSITHDIRDQLWAFWENISEQKKSAITKVTAEDIKKRFKEFSKGQDCKCGGCVENRRTFEKGLQNIVTYIHTSLLDEYTCDTSLKSEHCYNDDGNRVDDWENYEDYWFDCLVPCKDDVSFMLDENIVKERCLFMAFMEYFPAHSLVNESLRQIDASAVCHVVGGYDCFLFDDTQDYYLCSDEEDNGDVDNRNGQIKKSKDGNSPLSTHSIADSVQKGLFYVIACVGIICYERIIHEFRDMLAALNREMLLKELEMEKYVQEDETKSQKQAVKKKKKKRNIKEQQTSKGEIKEHLSGDFDEDKRPAANIGSAQTAEVSNIGGLQDPGEESYLEKTDQKSTLYNKLRDFAQSQIDSIQNNSPVLGNDNDHDKNFNVPADKRAHSIKLLHQLLPSLANNNSADFVETGDSALLEQELVQKFPDSTKDSSRGFGLRESICEDEDPIISNIMRSPPGLAPIGTPTFLNGSPSPLHSNSLLFNFRT
ncbi:hypothetical protein MP638_004649 [Amoeboaphelidium occidentale]|nr:hypothetical protein MP638_004649 [Amoeboaphelidium occidentale]